MGFWYGRRHLLPERSFYKLEGDTVDTFYRFGRMLDYRPTDRVVTGLQAQGSGEYGMYNAGPEFNTYGYAFGFPGDYNDYYGLN